MKIYILLFCIQLSRSLNFVSDDCKKQGEACSSPTARTRMSDECCQHLNLVCLEVDPDLPDLDTEDREAQTFLSSAARDLALNGIPNKIEVFLDNQERIFQLGYQRKKDLNRECAVAN
ncbi:uncharacterized protein LOC111712364 [Eurytemora carolleeae]|uniref:uncharacterized protein LOC111712364 n=1 Tax=Eurytemora carolleeae TaxID=1294199 RepID=UPI000C760BAE|nr:uncharacterized protein LOC111712364 [Eurytemora carolleeae]|eukprot:XP_023342715.1 uncharacterized protein LOC111712364 [Eurytemora affinis]